MYKKAYSILMLIFCMLAFCAVMVVCVYNGGLTVSADGMESAAGDAVNRIQDLTGFTWLNEIYGFGNLVLSPDEIISLPYVTVKDEDGYLEYFRSSSFDVLAAGRKICELSQFCALNGAEFSYVSYPSKSGAGKAPEDYGLEMKWEEVRGAFLDGLDSYGVTVLDIGRMLEDDGYTDKDVFYKTDHHWKSPAGLYAARAIADHLNEAYGYSLRSDLLDGSMFDFVTHDDLWLGEIGRKCSKTWVGALDEFTEIWPLYETSLKMGIRYGEYDEEGDFSMMVDRSGYDGSGDLYTYSAHYSYGSGIGSPMWIHNDNVSGERILIIKDSFSMVVIPFLSLTVSDIAVWDVRDSPGSLRDFIADNDFDAVVLAYTDFWSTRMYDFR